MVDRYTKVVVTVIALALTALVIKPFAQPGPVVAGDFKNVGPDALSGSQTIEVPRWWGRFAGASDDSLFFESPDGTIRRQLVRGGTIQWTRK